MLDRRSAAARVVDGHRWIIMAAIIAAGLLLSLVMVRLDQALDLHPDPDQVWIYGGGADGALGVLSAVSASTITVAGVIFSATYVTMQLASSQYTPRVVQALARQSSLHLVLGLLLADFVYSLMVLRSVRPATTANPEEFVPVLSLSVCVLLSIGCVAVLVYGITAGIRALQPTSLIGAAADETMALLRRSSRLSEQVNTADTSGEGMFDGVGLPVPTPRGGFVVRIQFEHLVTVAEAEDIAVRLDADIGHYCLPGEPILTIWPADRCTPQTAAAVLRTVVFDDERTPEQDVEFGFRRVADIMLKALSAAINDPTTAIYCLNTLGNLVVLLAREGPPQRFLTDANDTVRVIWRPDPFDRCVRTAYGQLRFYALGDLVLVAYALDSLGRVVALVPANRRGALMDEATRLRDAAMHHIHADLDRRAVQQASAWLDT